MPQLGTLHLTSCVYLRLANRPSAQFQNSSRQEQPPSSRYDPQVSGTRTAFLSSQARVLVLPSLHWAYFKQETPSNFFPTICSMQEAEKLLLMSYVRGPVYNGSSTKRHVLHSKSSSSQRLICYKVYI